MKKSNTSERLKFILKDRKIRQVDILEKAKPYCEKFNIRLGRNDLSQYVSGKVTPGQDKLTILGLALNVTEAWLMGYDVPMSREDSSPILNELVAPAKIKALRIKHGFSQEELASKVNIPVSLYSDYEERSNSLDESIIVNIFNALGEIPDGFAVENGNLYTRLVGGNIKSQRESLKITVKALSKKTDIPVDVIEAFEKETLFPTQQELELIAVALKTSADHLLGFPGFVLPDKRSETFSIKSKADKHEQSLLDEFRKLNELGKQVAIERVHELSEVPKYTEAKKEIVYPDLI